MIFVERALKVKRINTQVDTSAPALCEVEGLEKEIDQLVYALYGLTEEEIAIVEGKA